MIKDVRQLKDLESSIQLKKSYILFPIIIGLLTIIFWSVTFYLGRIQYDKTLLNMIEGIFLAIYAMICFISLTAKEDIYYFLATLLMAPFSFSHDFYPENVPLFLYTAAIIVIFGLFLRMFIFPKRFRLGKLSIGLIVFVVSLAFGGIGFNESNIVLQLFIVLFVGLVLTFVYSYLSQNKLNLSSLSFLMTILGFSLMIEFFIYYIFAFNGLCDKENLLLGWGNKNNYALVLSSCFIFGFYLSYKAQNKVLFIIYQLSSFILYGGVLLSLSKGSILVSTIALAFFIIFNFIHLHKNKAKFKLYSFTLSSIIIISLIICCILDFGFEIHIFSEIYESIIKGFDFSTLNNRIPIYSAHFELFLKKPIFGYGILYGENQEFVVDWLGSLGYQFSHSTILQTMMTAGIVGLFGLLFHYFEKYYSLLRHLNIQKLFILGSLLIPEIYGFFDVSYFYINYMIVIIVTFCFAENYLTPPPYLNKYISKINN